jgi:energy-coupling factor transporter ATP-binding protein EcfA2
LNRTQGTTLIVVTHNTQSANMARRIITLRDGKVISDTVPKDAFARDLIEFRHSGLGQVVMEDGQVPERLMEIAPALRELLRKA